MGALLVLIAIVLYFLPTIIAINRNHNNLVPIIVINIFLGWDGIGWIIALIWSLSNGSQVASLSSNKSEFSGQQNDIVEQLAKLSSLKNSGILTEMEFLELNSNLSLFGIRLRYNQIMKNIQ